MLVLLICLPLRRFSHSCLCNIYIYIYIYVWFSSLISPPVSSLFQNLELWFLQIGYIEPFAFSPAQGLPPCRQDRFVFPLTIPCVRLPSVNWLLWEKWKVRALPRGFLMGFDFRVWDSSSWFNLFNFWVLSLARPGAGASISSYFLWEGYADVWDMFWGKDWFWSLYFQIEILVMFCDIPQRLPSVWLGRGWYEFTSP